jgi:hypothetical protein
LKDALFEMANVETSVIARQPLEVKRQDLLRLSRLAGDLLAAVREHRASGERAA